MNRLILPYLLLFSITANSQLSIGNPVICHDKDDYLKCYNNGTFKVDFDKGNIKRFVYKDSVFTYIPAGKFSYILFKDVEVRLLPNSIEIKKGGKTHTLTSLKDDFKPLEEYHIYPYTENGEIRAFTFTLNNELIYIEIGDYDKTWYYKIYSKETEPKFLISLDFFKTYLVQSASFADDSSDYTTFISSRFRKGKKIKSFYTNRYKSPPPYVPYYFNYNKKGALIRKKSKGEIKVCECN